MGGFIWVPKSGQYSSITMETRYNEQKQKTEKQSRYDETSVLRTNFASLLPLCYIEVPLYLGLTWTHGMK